ncbi:hypothetical protein [Oryzihumus sp.]
MLFRVAVRRGTGRGVGGAGRQRLRHPQPVQQLATSVGAALISTTYLTGSATGSGHAVIRSLVVVLAVVAVCFACLPLLPRRAAADAH